MARRAKLIQKRAKITRVTRSEQYLVNLKYMGDEPSFSGKLTRLEFAKACNWYNTMCGVSEARDYLKTYLKNQARTNETRLLSRVSDTWINTTSAWIARLISRGYDLPGTERAWLEEKLTQTFKKASPEASEKPATAKPSVHDRMREKAHDIVGEIEALVDAGEFSLYDWLKANEVSPAYGNSIIARYAPWLEELLEAMEGKDPQLKEAYAYMSKRELKARIQFVNNMLEDVDRYCNNTKKARAPRKTRPPSVEKILKNLRYQSDSPEYKIQSINPAKIIGAQELWVFNTKYKIVTVFRAIDRAGLSVNRSSIIGFDEKNSFTKRTGRKPEYLIDKILNGGKLVLKKIMDEAKGELPLAHRLNENIVLLKVV